MSIPVRRPPDALVYCSRSSGDDANGRTICVYVSCIRRGVGGSEDGDEVISEVGGFAVPLRSTSDQRPRLRIGMKLKADLFQVRAQNVFAYLEAGLDFSPKRAIIQVVERLENDIFTH